MKRILLALFCLTISFHMEAQITEIRDSLVYDENTMVGTYIISGMGYVGDGEYICKYPSYKVAIPSAWIKIGVGRTSAFILSKREQYVFIRLSLCPNSTDTIYEPNREELMDAYEDFLYSTTQSDFFVECDKHNRFARHVRFYRTPFRLFRKSFICKKTNATIYLVNIKKKDCVHLLGVIEKSFTILDEGFYNDSSPCPWM